MANKELLDYVKEQLVLNTGRQEIQDSLAANGWSPAEIEEAFKLNEPQNIAAAATSAIPAIPATPEAPVFTPPVGARQPKKANPVLWALLGIIVGVMIIGGAVFGYFYYFPSPETVFQKMFANLAQVKSYAYSGQINGQATVPANIAQGFSLKSIMASLAQNLTESPTTAQTPLANVPQKFSIDFDGASDINDQENPKGFINLKLVGGTVEQEQFSFVLNMIVIGKAVYLKFDAPNIGLLFGSAANQWIKIDSKSLESFKSLNPSAENIGNANELAPAQKEKLITLFEQAELIKSIEKLTGEKIDGKDTYHYKIVLDKDEFKNLILGIIDVVSPERVLKGEELSIFNGEWAKVELPESEIWIGKKDYLPYKISSSFIIEKSGVNEVSGNVDFVMQYKNFNQPVSVAAPSPVKTIEEIIGGFFGGLGLPVTNAANSPVSNAQLPEDIKLPQGMELIK